MLCLSSRGTLAVFIFSKLILFIFIILSSLSYGSVLLGHKTQSRHLAAQTEPINVDDSAALIVKQQPIYLDFDERLVVSFVLQSQMQNQETQMAIHSKLRQILTDKLSKPIETIEVKNFEEFLEKSKADWPDTSSLSQDLAIIESQPSKPLKRFTSQNPRIQKKINEYRKYKSEYFKDLLVQKSKDRVLDVELLSHLASIKSDLQIESENFDTKKQVLAIKNLFNQSSQSVFTKLIANLDQMGDVIAEQLEKNNLELNPVFKKILKTIFTEYFKRLSLDSKKQILSSMLSLPINTNDETRFISLVQNSGPIFQKFLQILGAQKDIPQDMLKLFKMLESSVRPVPWVEVNQILTSEKNNYDFISVEQKPLGVGTMAQVHRAKIAVGGKTKSVVMRFIKPRIALRVREDEVILKQIAQILDQDPFLIQSGLPKVSTLIDDITKSVLDELDIHSTVERQIKAQSSYNREFLVKGRRYKNILKTHVPEIYLPRDKSSELMVQELVFGTKLDKVAEQYMSVEPQLKRLIAESIAKMWIEETFFGKGFYHSDLHQGNFLVSVQDSHIQVNLLDFGMGGFVDRRIQNKFLVLGMALESFDVNFISQSFWDLSILSENTINQDQLKKNIQAKVKSLNRQTLPMAEWLGFVMNLGLKMQYEVINLNRGLTIQSQMLLESKSSKNLNSIVRDIVLANPKEFFQRVVIEENINLELLTKISWLEIKNIFSKLPTFVGGKPKISAKSCQALF